VKIQVTDAAGAEVRELDGPREAGIHRVTWDLRTPGAADRIVPGVYVVRLLANGRTSMAPLDVRADPNR
jgi:hypothetical protein